MKNNLDKPKLQFCGYVVLTAAAIYIVITVLNNIADIWTFAHNLLGTLISLLAPFLIAIAVAYLLWIPVRALDTKLKKIPNKYHRGISVLTVYIILTAGVLGFFLLLYYMIGGKLSQIFSLNEIIDYITQYISQNQFDPSYIQHQLENLPIDETIRDALTSYISSIASTLQNIIFNSITGLFSSITSLVSNLFSMFICLVLSIYLLLDKEYFLELWNKIYFICFRESKIGRQLKNAGHIFNQTFADYIRGQLLEAFFVGVLATIALLLLDVDYAVIIGIIAGITNMIPYIGPLIGTVLAGIMALFKGDLLLVLWVVIAMQLVQQIDNNFLQPKIVGKSVELHAVFTMIAILVGGNIGGLFGMLTAVPIFASVKKLMGTWYASQDLESKRQAEIKAVAAESDPDGHKTDSSADTEEKS